MVVVVVVVVVGVVLLLLLLASPEKKNRIRLQPKTQAPGGSGNPDLKNASPPASCLIPDGLVKIFALVGVGEIYQLPDASKIRGQAVRSEHYKEKIK